MTNRRGTVLLEALVALTILSLSLVAAMAAMGAASRSVALVRQREETLTQASRVLGVYALMTEGELAQRIGTQEVERFTVTVQRPVPTLYRVAVRDTADTGQELLATLVFRGPSP